MIKLLDYTKTTIAFLNEIDDYYIESNLETADKTVHFKLPTTSEFTTQISHGMYLKNATDEFIIKEINYSDYQYIEIFGKLNVEDLQGSIIKEFETVNKSIDEIMDSILDGTGWTWQFANPTTKNRTVRKLNATPYDLVMEVVGTYGVEVEFDSVNKIVKFYQMIGLDRGAYIYSDLNLKSCEYQSDIYDLTTVIYPYGADGLTIESVNDGIDYVTNFTHTSKVIEKVWEDDRYTDPQSLKDDAIAMLENLAQPRVSFVVDVLDLSGIQDDYAILDFRLGDSVRIIDKNDPFLGIVAEVNPNYNETTFNGSTFNSSTFFGYVDNETLEKSDMLYGSPFGGDVSKSPQLVDITKHRIVKLTEYPFTPEKNKAEFSNVQITIKNATREINTAIEKVNYTIEDTRTNLDAAIESATALIKANNGGYVVMRYNENDQPYEMLIMDTDDIGTASNVWRWNQNGLGYSSSGYSGTYETAITSDGKIVANFITTGMLDASVIGAGSIVADKLAANSVTADKISAGSINADKIASNAITTAKINAGAVTATEIASNAITADKISAGAVNADKINVSSLSAITADLGTVNAGTINGVTMNSTTMNGGNIVLSGNSNNSPLRIDTSDGRYCQLYANWFRMWDSSQSNILAQIFCFSDSGNLYLQNTSNPAFNIDVVPAIGRLTSYDLQATNKIMAGNLASGKVTINPTANSPTYVTASYGKTFGNVPSTTATAQTSVPGDGLIEVGVSSPTTSNVRIYIYRTNTTQTIVHWNAVDY